MVRAVRLGTLAVGGCLFALTAVAPGSAQPQVPATFFGTAAIDGAPVPDGTAVRAFVGDVDCTQDGPNERGTVTEAGVSVYSILVVHETARAGCGTEGAEVTFTIDGRPANERGRWTAVPQQLNLNAGAGAPVDLPPATAAPTLDATALAATATERARFTPLPATALPTDDPNVLATPAGRDRDDGAGDSNVATAVLIAIAALAVVGGASGIWLSRRGRRRGGRGAG